MTRDSTLCFTGHTGMDRKIFHIKSPLHAITRHIYTKLRERSPRMFSGSETKWHRVALVRSTELLRPDQINSTAGWEQTLVHPFSWFLHSQYLKDQSLTRGKNTPNHTKKVASKETVRMPNGQHLDSHLGSSFLYENRQNFIDLVWWPLSKDSSIQLFKTHRTPDKLLLTSHYYVYQI